MVGKCQLGGLAHVPDDLPVCVEIETVRGIGEVIQNKLLRRSGRVAECDGLENR